MLSEKFRTAKALRASGREAAAVSLIQSSAVASDEDAFEAIVCFFGTGNVAEARRVRDGHRWTAEWASRSSEAIVEAMMRGRRGSLDPERAGKRRRDSDLSAPPAAEWPRRRRIPIRARAPAGSAGEGEPAPHRDQRHRRREGRLGACALGGAGRPRRKSEQLPRAARAELRRAAVRQSRGGARLCQARRQTRRDIAGSGVPADELPKWRRRSLRCNRSVPAPQERERRRSAALRPARRGLPRPR